MISRTANNTETELKLRLTALEHGKILKILKRHLSRVERQVNVYFDTPQAELRKLGWALRVRMINNLRAQMTLKQSIALAHKKRMPKALSRRKEFESRISLSTAKKLVRGTRHLIGIKNTPIQTFKRLAPQIELLNVRSIGSIRNIRHVFKGCGTIEIELDCTKINKTSYYELEVETEHPAAAMKEVRHLFQSLKIAVRPNKQTKYGLFLKSLRHKKGA